MISFATRTVACTLAALLLLTAAGCEMCRDIQHYHQVESAHRAEAQGAYAHTPQYDCPCPQCAVAPAPPQTPMMVPALGPAPAIAPPPPGVACAEIFFPTGQPANAAIHVRKCAPASVQVGMPFDYTMTVRNLTGETLRNVVLIDELPLNFQMGVPQPSPSSVEGNIVTWRLGDLGPHQSRDIRIPGCATTPGELINCVIVTFDMPVCLTVPVADPKLELHKHAPDSVLKCETIPVRLVVSNTGTGSAHNVQVVDKLPEGLVTVDGRREVAFNVGELHEGQSRELAMDLRAERTGVFTNRAYATADGGLRAEASSTTKVCQPILTIDKTGPGKQVLGRNISYEITVKNTGDGPAAETVLEDLIPAGVELLEVSDGGVAQGGKVVWQLGTLEPGDARTVSMKVGGAAIGEVTNVVNARAYCAPPVDDTVVTLVQGIPAILLEVIDIEDPVEVGAETTYEIRVTNQGTMPDTNIGLTARLESQAEFVSGEGLTTVSHANRLITLAPVPELQPKATARWRIRVKAVATGDIRFHVQMNSDQLKRNVMETEATHFYE